MKKVFIVTFLMMFSSTIAFAGDDKKKDTNQLRELDKREEPEYGGGGTADDIYVYTFRGWCGDARVRKAFNHEPSDLETLGYRMQADRDCNIMRNGPIGILGT